MDAIAEGFQVAMDTMETEHVVWVVAGVASLIATLLSVQHVAQHISAFADPVRQKYIVRIVLMVPIYAIGSWLSLRFLDHAVYLDLARDCYEGFVIYSFVMLVIDYGDGEAGLRKLLKNKPAQAHMWPLNYFLKPYSMASPTFIHTIKQCVLQYVIVKPLMAVLAVTLEHLDMYDEGHFSLTGGYLYVTIINNLSVTTAMYGLLYLYLGTKVELHHYGPTPKLLCIKGVLFLTFWQSIACALLCKVGVIHDTIHHTAADINTGLQDYLVCFEMLAAAIAHRYAYSVTEFTEAKHGHDKSTGKDKVTVGKKLSAIFSATDVVRDVVSCFTQPPKIVKGDKDN